MTKIIAAPWQVRATETVPRNLPVASNILHHKQLLVRFLACLPGLN